jgi:6-phosphogluconolactonase
MGDGHTLSLFPGDDAAVAESKRWCIHTKAPPPFAVTNRVTMTLPLVNAARLRLFMVTGTDKRRDSTPSSRARKRPRPRW